MDWIRTDPTALAKNTCVSRIFDENSSKILAVYASFSAQVSADCRDRHNPNLNRQNVLSAYSVESFLGRYAVMPSCGLQSAFHIQIVPRADLRTQQITLTLIFRKIFLGIKVRVTYPHT